MSRLVTKANVSKMLGRMKGQKIEVGETYICFNKIIDRFLFSCVLKGIINYDMLSLKEKIILNEILEDKHKFYYFCEKTKQVNLRALK